MTKKFLLSRLILGLLILGLSASAATAEVERIERGNLRIEGIPEIPATVSDRLGQYQNTRSARLADWMPVGGGLLISTRFGETTQLHVVATAKGARRQITFFDEPIGGADVSPDPQVNGFLYSRDVGGSEFYQIFFFDLASGESRMLTDGTSRNGGAVWANTGNFFVHFTTQRNGRDWDLHVVDLATGESSPVLQEGGTWMPIDWSPDDTQLLVARYVSANESYPYLLDLASGELTSLHEGEEKVSYGGAVFTIDGGTPQTFNLAGNGALKQLLTTT